MPAAWQGPAGEIHGASALGYEPGDNYLFQGRHYVLDAERDVLVREDVDSWIVSHRKKITCESN